MKYSSPEIGIEFPSSLVLNVQRCQEQHIQLPLPPFGTDLDIAPKLDKDFRPVVATEEPMKIPIGSTAVLKAIEEYQPLVGMHGHVHESPGEAKIG